METVPLSKYQHMKHIVLWKLQGCKWQIKSNNYTVLISMIISTF